MGCGGGKAAKGAVAEARKGMEPIISKENVHCAEISCLKIFSINVLELLVSRGALRGHTQRKNRQQHSASLMRVIMRVDETRHP